MATKVTYITPTHEEWFIGFHIIAEKEKPNGRKYVISIGQERSKGYVVYKEITKVIGKKKMMSAIEIIKETIQKKRLKETE